MQIQWDNEHFFLVFFFAAIAIYVEAFTKWAPEFTPLNFGIIAQRHIEYLSISISASSLQIYAWWRRGSTKWYSKEN